MDVKLTFINNSNDSDNSQVVVFQKNVATNFADGPQIAWRTFNTGKHGTPHPVIYPEAALTASAFTSFEDAPPPVHVNKGDALSLIGTTAAHTLSHKGKASAADEIHIGNGLAVAANASIYRGGKLLAMRAGLHPGETAAFKFEPVLWIAFLDDIREGELFTLTDDIQPVPINLIGLKNADVILTGGGSGRDIAPHHITIVPH